MTFLKLLLPILVFNEILVDLDAKNCPKGQKVVSQRGHACEACSEGYFQSEENASQECRPCTLCDQKTGSEIKQQCTRETDTVCQCRRNFVPRLNDFSVCKCDIGFGITSHWPGCSKCEDGYFSTKMNTHCQKWKVCSSSAGVLTSGTATSDVACKAELQSASHTTILPSSNKIVSLTTLTNRRPHEGTQTLKMFLSVTTQSPQQVTAEENLQPIPPSNTGNQSGVAFVLLGIAVILMILTAIVCKWHGTPCWKKKTTADLQTKDSLCRSPVEEIGDGSKLSLKQNPEEV